MSDTANNNRVNRLLDMIVEEVSIVDRAANKRRFLIVKRSQEMAEDLNMKENEQAVAGEGSDEMPDDINALEAGEGARNAAGQDDDWSGDTSPIEQAKVALEQLGGAVAALTKEQPETLLDLGVKLRQVADMVTGEQAGDGTGSPETTPKPQGDMVPAAGDGQNDVLDSLRQQIATLNSNLNALAQKEADAQPKTPTKKQALTGVEQIEQLTKAVMSLTKVFQSHQRRLTRMEKSYGLPNSLPTNESVRRKEDRCWPMDLNGEDF